MNCDQVNSRAAAAQQPRRTVPGSSRSPHRKRSRPEGEDKGTQLADTFHSDLRLLIQTRFFNSIEIQHKNQMMKCIVKERRAEAKKYSLSDELTSLRRDQRP